MLTSKVDDHPRPLPVLEQAWLDCFAKLKRLGVESGAGSTNLAAPFLSDALPGYEVGGPGTVMLVGKATEGKNTLGNTDVADAYDAATIKRRTPAVIEEVISGAYSSSFWRFARQLSDAAANQAGLNKAPFANLIWTNVAKLGVTVGVPDSDLLDKQDSLMVETLISEVLFYRPKLVVFVTHNFAFGRISRILSRLVGSKEGEGRTSESDWSSPHQVNAPAVLWTSHPQGKPNEWVQAKIARARELLAG